MTLPFSWFKPTQALTNLKLYSLPENPGCL